MRNYESTVKNPDVDYNVTVYYSGKNCSLHELKGFCEKEAAVSCRILTGKGTYRFSRKSFFSWVAKRVDIDESQIVLIRAESSIDILCPRSDMSTVRKTVELGTRNLWGKDVPSKIKRFVRNKL